MKIDTITYCFRIEHRCPNPRTTLIRVDAAPLVVAFSAFRALSCIESSSRVSPNSTSKRAHPTFKEFTRQGQHLACIPTPYSPLKQASVLVEPNNVAKPSHSVPDEVVITATFGTSHGPTQPLMVSWTRFNSPRFRHSLFSHPTGTSGKPCSTLPQQQPRQIVTCPTTRRFVFSGQSRSSFTVSIRPIFLEGI
jgi:hypothetical protein